MDVIDVAQRRQQEDIDHVLASRKPTGAGRTHCANLDCGEAIAPIRQQMGATLCIDCQRDAEQGTHACARTAV
ncbi:hypothetical protein PY254_10540 [Rhodanobacter sp. AS-Z3]|uniref:hypothetical protein n=1 Tax=Rhodanobacter sp. AS-Z3 TaxID=3031330 RepID=UPI00247ABADF|nr:hypothetical protein [Rhodanobacter sp. AS-Z3]WEN13684.1 hypothetical protein PY254_10540 [Rhodanobacter sp. AS-Z3]